MTAATFITPPSKPDRTPIDPPPAIEFIGLEVYVDCDGEHLTGRVGFPYVAGDLTEAAKACGKSGSQSNILTPSATAPDTPTTAEFRAALRDGITRLLQLKTDQGEPMSQDATGLVCITPPGMYLTALEALNAALIGGGDSNVLQNAADVIAFPRLTDASKFLILKTNVAVRPLVFQDRSPVEWQALEANSETGFVREVYQYGVRARYRLTYGYWQRVLSLDFT